MTREPDVPNETIKKAVPLSDESVFLRRFSSPAEYPPPPVSSMWRRAVVLALQTLTLVAVFASIYLAHQYSLRRMTFKVDRILLAGCKHLDGKEVQALIRNAFPQNLMLLDAHELCRRMRNFSWVKDVTVRKVYPDRLYLQVVEREPIGIARMDKLWLFDEYGVFLDEYVPSRHQVDKPVLAGLHELADPMTSDDNLERIRRYSDFLREIDQGPNPLSRQISEVDLNDLTDLVVVPLEGTPRVHLGYEKLGARLQRYFKIIGRATEENGPISEVDMRLDDKIIVRPLAVKQEG